MAVADLLKKITDDATFQCEAVLTEAREEVSKIEQATEARISALSSQYEKDTISSLEATRRKVESMAEREGKLKLESLKRQLLNEVFEEVAKKITALSDENYQAFIEKQLTELPKDMKVVAMIPADRVAVTKKALKAVGINVSETEDAEFAVGVVLRGTDFEYDLSLERILGELKSKKDMEIASELFSD